MGINKVNYGNTTLIDTSNVTVTADKLMSGYTALDNSGTLITGTATPTPSLQTKTVSYTPSETAQTETVTADSGYDGLDEVDVSVAAVSSTYVGSGITRRSSTDMTASGATVTAPAGYYASSASKAVASGTAGTPTATKGTVSNHSVSVTPSVTNTTGYITGSTKTGTAVTVSASELVSGSETKTSNGTYDVTNLAELVVNVASSGVHIGTKTFTGYAGSTTQKITGLAGEPKAFFIRITQQLTRSSSNTEYYITDVVYNGSTTKNNYWRASNGTLYIDATNCTWTYSDGTFAITYAQSNKGIFRSSYSYELTYIY